MKTIQQFSITSLLPYKCNSLDVSSGSSLNELSVFAPNPSESHQLQIVLFCPLSKGVFLEIGIAKMRQKVQPEVNPNILILTLELGVLAFPICWFSQAISIFGWCYSVCVISINCVEITFEGCRNTIWKVIFLFTCPVLP